MKKQKKTKTPKTRDYFKSLIKYKRTHIRRERERLRQLEEMLEEVEGK